MDISEVGSKFLWRDSVKYHCIIPFIGIFFNHDASRGLCRKNPLLLERAFYALHKFNYKFSRLFSV